MSTLIGQNIKGYELRTLIGEGGFGAVYRANQPTVGRDVAVKIILPEYANQPDFIRRFEVEAQLVARLEHPYIVPLFDYWREPGGAYLVMRLLRGGSLRDSLNKGPWKVSDLARLLDQISGALNVAHKNGVVHRDIKPANILLDEEGNAYLSDFGIAKVAPLNNQEEIENFEDTTQPEMIVGSPAYVSPEQIMGEPVTAQSDLYSLGIILYEALAGQHPYHDVQMTTMLVKHVQDPLPSLLDRRPDVPAGIERVINKAVAKKPQDRYPSAIALAAAFRRAMAFSNTDTQPALVTIDPNKTTPDITPSTPSDLELPPPENPYKGLRAFQEADAQDFFGREALVQQLIVRMAETEEMPRFLAVLGPSGSGKSSVIRAGLIPSLRRGMLKNSEQWFMVDMTPSVNPLEELEAALLSVAVNPPESLLNQLREDERGLIRAVKRVLPRDEASELVLFIDQFEELFTMTEDEAARTHFLNSLVAAVSEPRGRLRVIISLRADFYDKPLLYPDFGELIRKRTEVVLPFSADDLERAIVGPAERVGVMMEPGLLATIIADVNQQPGALPLLQYALTELFERREGRRLTRAAYQVIGGVLGALARRAEEIYDALDINRQESARQVFLRLVTPGQGVEDTRRRVLRSELGTSASTESVIAAFGKNRLLTFDRDPMTRESTVEVAHEALVREWSRLRTWLNASRETLRLERLLSAAATEWLNSGKDQSFLASGARLAQFEVLAAETDLALTVSEADYIRSSIAQRESIRLAEEARQARELQFQRRTATRLRALVAALSIFLFIAAALAVYAVNSRQQAVGESIVRATQQQIAIDNAATAQASFKSLAKSESRRLAAEANDVLESSNNRSADLGLLLALRALQTAYTPEADAILLRSLNNTYVRVQLLGHTDVVNSGVFSPDGKYVVSGSDDNSIRLWDTQTGLEIRQYKGHTDRINSVTFSPNGKFIASGSSDNTVRLWDVQTDDQIATYEGHTSFVTTVAFSPDGKLVASGSRDNTIRIWDIKTGGEIRRYEGATSYITALAFSPDGKTIIVASLDGQLRRLVTENGQLAQSYIGHTSYVTSVRFSKDGKFLISGSDDRSAILWNTATASLIIKFTGHKDAINSVDILFDDRLIVTSSLDGTVRLWDADTGTEIRQYVGHKDYVTSVRFSDDGRYLLTASRDKSLRVWNVQAGGETRQFVGHTDKITSVTFSPDNKYILTASYDGTARLWDAATGYEVRRFEGHIGGIIAFFSPDGKYVLTGGDDGTARLWNTGTGTELNRFEAHTGRVISVAFSTDGKYVLTGGVDATAKLWNVSSGKLIYTFTGHTGGVSAIFSPDGKFILTASVDGTAKLWDVQTGKELYTFKGHTGRVVAAFSPDGQTVVTGSADRTARLWDTNTGKQFRVFVGHTGPIIAVAFSPDGHLVLTASADNTARLWDAPTGTQLRVFVGHTDALTTAIFSPDGKYILTGSKDRTARLWDTSGAEIRRITGHTAEISSIYGIAFSPNGKFIVTGSADRTARLWDTSYQDTMGNACKRIFRDFTAVERAKFNIGDDRPTCVQP